MDKELEKELKELIKALGSLDIVAGDVVKRTNPHSTLLLNTNGVWLASQDIKSRHNAKKIKELFDKLKDCIDNE